jgi:hypothetical protein
MRSDDGGRTWSGYRAPLRRAIRTSSPSIPPPCPAYEGGRTGPAVSRRRPDAWRNATGQKLTMLRSVSRKSNGSGGRWRRQRVSSPLATEDGAFVEPPGSNRWQPVANGQAGRLPVRVRKRALQKRRTSALARMCSVARSASEGLDGAVYGAFASRTAARRLDVLARLAVVAYPA